MKNIKKLTSIVLLGCFGLVQSGCLGSFKLTNVTYQWNQTVGSKWINELVFVLFIPVYSITLVIDGFILNAVDFWTERPGLSMKVGDEKLIDTKDGKDQYLVTKTSDGFTIEQLTGALSGEKAELAYDESSLTWFIKKDDSMIRLVQLIESDQGNFVKVYKEDGTSVLVDANQRNREEILEQIGNPTVSASL